MFETIDYLHRALRTQSPWAFIFIVAGAFGLAAFVGSGFVAWIIERGYQNTLHAQSAPTTTQPSIASAPVMPVASFPPRTHVSTTRVSKKETAQISQNGQNNIAQVGNNNTATITNLPDPKVTTEPTEPARYNIQDGALFRSEIILRVDSKVAIPNLSLKVMVPTIKRLDVIPQRSGTGFMGFSGVRDGYAFTNLPNAFGRYKLVIFTEQPGQKFEVEWNDE